MLEGSKYALADIASFSPAILIAARNLIYEDAFLQALRMFRSVLRYDPAFPQLEMS